MMNGQGQEPLVRVSAVNFLQCILTLLVGLQEEHLACEKPKPMTLLVG